MKKILSELISFLILVFATITGYNYFIGRKNSDVQKKIDKRKKEIESLDTAGLVNLANSILNSRNSKSK